MFMISYLKKATVNNRLNIDIALYIPVFCLTILLSLTCSENLENCPFRKEEWIIREKLKDCNHPMSYHCLIDVNGNPTEFCLKEQEYDTASILEEPGRFSVNLAGLCPWVWKQDDKKYLLGVPPIPCGNNTHCPVEGKKFYSNKLYQYPACLVKEGERQNFTLPEPTDNKKATVVSSNQNEESSTKNWLIPTIFVIVIVVVIGILLIVRKRRKGDQPESKFEHGTLTFDLKRAIKRGDIAAVEEIYRDVLRMTKKTYKKYAPEEGSFLMYAVSKGKEEIFLFFLRRQLQGEPLFEQDNYSSKINKDITEIASTNQWNDVLEKLHEIDEMNSESDLQQQNDSRRQFISHDSQA